MLSGSFLTPDQNPTGRPYQKHKTYSNEIDHNYQMESFTEWIKNWLNGVRILNIVRNGRYLQLPCTQPVAIIL